MTPGEVGIPPPKTGELPLGPGRTMTERPPPFELQPPEGKALEPTQKPLVRRDTAGDVMAPADWDRGALKALGTKGERPSAEGPAVPHEPLRRARRQGTRHPAEPNRDTRWWPRPAPRVGPRLPAETPNRSGKTETRGHGDPPTGRAA